MSFVISISDLAVCRRSRSFLQQPWCKWVYRLTWMSARRTAGPHVGRHVSPSSVSQHGSGNGPGPGPGHRIVRTGRMRCSCAHRARAAAFCTLRSSSHTTHTRQITMDPNFFLSGQRLQCSPSLCVGCGIRGCLTVRMGARSRRTASIYSGKIRRQNCY